MCVSEFVPTRTVTLLLASEISDAITDAERSPQPWDTTLGTGVDALERLAGTVAEIITTHGGVGPVRPDSEARGPHAFLAVFARATDALACAIDLQQAPLAPIQLRVAVHTGEVQLADSGRYAGPTVQRAARLRDLAHGGQVVVSGTTHDLVVDHLPDDVWLVDLGTHQLRDLPRPERVAQLCHPDLRVEFPPLQGPNEPNDGAPHGLPVQLTRFVGRTGQINDVRKFVGDNRLVTLAGVGGVGKTRLAVQIATQSAADFDGGVWFVDLAPVSEPDLVPVALLRAFGLPDQPGRSAIDTLARFVGDRDVLVILDNCEHLVDACGTLLRALLGTCANLAVLATSRAPIGVPGELTWRVPSLSLSDEAIELFVDRARLARPDFSIDPADTAAISDICDRVDGLPLGIELAAAAVRVMSLSEILDGLRNRFRLLTGSTAGTPTPRRQTLGASVDWSHAMLTEPERVAFRRLAVFSGGFDHEAARTVCADEQLQPHQVLDQLTLLVDKSLVLADNSGDRTRFRMLATVRHYALERLQQSGEGALVRTRHRDHYAHMAALLDSPTDGEHQRRIEQVETEIDNLRAAFAWCRDNDEIESALELTSSLQPLWLTRGRIQEGLAWFDAVLTDRRALSAVPPVVRGRALADKAALDASRSIHDNLDEAQQAVAIAREIGDPALLARALTACGAISSYSAEAARPFLAEAIGIARELGDRWRLTQILTWQAYGAFYAGDPVAGHAASREGQLLAEEIGDQFNARSCRWTLGLAQMMKGDLAEAITQFHAVTADADAAHDVLFRWGSRLALSNALALRGDTDGAKAAAHASLAAAADLWPYNEGFSYAVLATAAVASGDVAAAAQASEAAQQRLSVQGELAGANTNPMAEVALARGDLVTAGRWADQEVAASAGWHLARALTTRARIAIAKSEPDQAERDAHKALACAAEHAAHLAVPDILECLGRLDADGLSHRDATRLFGAAHEIRRRLGSVRFKVYDEDHQATLAALREALGEKAFDDAWADGAGLSLSEAIAYVRRGRGERKRPASGWASLTPTERDVVRLVAEGLANNEIAARLFVSRRTVQTHLTHVYAKLGISSRVQLAQESVSHG